MLKLIKNISQKQCIQYALTVLLTGMILYLTSALWCKGIVVSFNVQSDKSIEYQVFYTETPEQDFNEKQSIKKNILKGFQKVEFILPIGKIAKFRLAFGNEPEKIEISDLKIKGSESVEPDYSEFAENDINYSVTDEGKILLSFYENVPYVSLCNTNPYITYKKDLNLVRNDRIDWCRLIVIAVLAFLLMFKFTKHLSEKRYSRSDMVMVTVFFALLFIPMSYISDTEISEKEYRMLAQKPSVSIYDEDGESFGERFDAWYNDHFFGRDEITEFYKNVIALVSPTLQNDKVLIGKDGWLFFKENNGMNNYANVVDLPERNMENGLRYLKAIDDWCKEHNKKFYYVIAPDKGKIYGEYYRLIRKQRSDDYSIAMQFVDYIRKNSDIKVIYPRDELLKHKKDGLVYYKDDTHWSEFGAYWAYKTIADVISEDYEIKRININKWPNNDIRSSYDLHKFLNKGYEDSIMRKSPEYLYKSPEYVMKADCVMETRYGKSDEGLILCENKENRYNVFVLRDSFFSWLIPYTADTFNVSKILWKHNMEFEDLEDIEQNYDIVILESIERFIPFILKQRFPYFPRYY